MCRQEYSLFMKLLHQRPYPYAMVSDLKELGVENTSQYDPYEKKSQNEKMFPVLDEEPKVTPGWGTNM